MKLICSLLFSVSFTFLLSQNCGVERWKVKTLSDSDTIEIDFRKIISTSVRHQATLEIANERLLEKRLESERTVYTFPCLILGFKREKDRDIHVIVKDTATENTMVIEVISPDCYEVQQTSREEHFRELYEWFYAIIGIPSSSYKMLPHPIPVTITGIGFWDFPHSQTGAAPNFREIHPVLSIVKH